MTYPTIQHLMENSEAGHKLARFIVDNCQPYFKAVRGNTHATMFRGLQHSDVKTSRIVKVRDDRNPRMMNAGETLAWQKAIQSAGKIAHRTNSVMVIGDYDAAAGFGYKERAVVVIPIGEFNYTWVPGIDDGNWSTSKEQKAALDARMADRASRGLPEMGQHDDEFVEWRDRTIGDVKNIHGDDNTLTHALRSYHEVMIRPVGGKVLYINLEHWQFDVQPALQQLMNGNK